MGSGEIAQAEREIQLSPRGRCKPPFPATALKVDGGPPNGQGEQGKAADSATTHVDGQLVADDETLRGSADKFAQSARDFSDALPVRQERFVAKRFGCSAATHLELGSSNRARAWNKIKYR